MPLPLLATQLVGSYTKPRWLYRREALLARQLDAIWAPAPEVLAEAKQDAIRLAILDQERAGLDIITDGEQGRESFATYFYRLGGIDHETLGPQQREGIDLSFVSVSRESQIHQPTTLVPRIVGPLTWREPMALEDLRFLKQHTAKPVKMTVIGPITASTRLSDAYYGDTRAAALGMAEALNHELRVLDEEGVDLLQIDEPDVHFLSSVTNPFVAEVIDRVIEGVRAKTVIHICYGYSIAMKNKRVDERFGTMLDAVAKSRIDFINIEYEEPGHQADLLTHVGDRGLVLGVLNLGTEQVESPEHIAARVREALAVVPADRLLLSPDCGMWFLPRHVAYAKIRAMALAAAIVRAELQPLR
ncbi:MAG: 5-methyltetrahydropteroyltriglutamate--homocysteine methyltransferase [Dehalococcoidia bacterium]|nr:MAG: 5-methyltetrahydropteroyltriglutamate--homocysteine methyltransferase [Dehalococcoidia bacterium]